MPEQKNPLISCIMPTYNRRTFVPHAIRYFLQQEYDNKELIIIDDGSDLIQDIIPDHPAIRYFQLKSRVSLGKKLNLACSYATGDIIIHWDDDDWYSKGRLQYQARILNRENTSLCGINRLLYYDVINKSAYQYIYPPTQRKWLLGSSLGYTKELWNVNRFADIDVGMDGLFVWNTPVEKIVELDDNQFAVHMIHQNNISPKNTTGTWWHKHPVEEIKNLLGGDWAVYNDGYIKEANRIEITEQKFSKVVETAIEIPSRPVKNIYACLVHEKIDCVVDLVRNLNYNDPSSVIILYNGGTNLDLLEDDFPFHKYNAVIYPRPTPMKHGYLHRFALDTMEFALANYSFDTFTIVDSDQLSVRAGYSNFLGRFLAESPGYGMLSSAPERVNFNNNNNYVAARAIREYELWKPLLLKFTGGDKSFVHWTFWPATVFFSNAVKELTAFFKRDRTLQDIIQKSTIWATEEVILPTLVKLLGYEIGANPCSYQFVKYQEYACISKVEEILNYKDAYWVHPVYRNFDDPVRKMIREHFKEYRFDSANTKDASLNDCGKIALVNQVKNIEGWLSDKEALLLLNLALQVCHDPGLIHDMVEVGSYHGKSTILLSNVLKRCSPASRVTSVDPHDGLMGDEDQGLHSFPPSLEDFKKNIRDGGVSEIINIIQKKSRDVEWYQPISLLFIDALHDYKNVSDDFYHFSKWIKIGGYVAFHDYAGYFPAVIIFVDELLETGTYQKVQLVESLIVLQKMR